MVLPPSTWAYCSRFSRTLRTQWTQIGCESEWACLPWARVRFKDQQLEKQYLKLKREDTRETAKLLGVIVSLAIIGFAIALAIQLQTNVWTNVGLEAFWPRIGTPLVMSIVVVFYGLFHKQIVRWYLCMAMTKGDHSDLWTGSPDGRSASRLVATLDDVLQPYYRVEWYVLYGFFLATSVAVSSQVHFIGKLRDMFGSSQLMAWKEAEHPEVPGIIILKPEFEHYVAAEFQNVAVAALAFMIFKCDSFATSWLILVHQVLRYVANYVFGSPIYTCFYPIVGILMIAASRQVEYFYRSALFQTDKVAREKGQRRRLLESFAYMVDIAAWEWDSAGNVQTDFYQTRVIEALTGRSRGSEHPGAFPRRALEQALVPDMAKSEKSVASTAFKYPSHPLSRLKLAAPPSLTGVSSTGYSVHKDKTAVSRTVTPPISKDLSETRAPSKDDNSGPPSSSTESGGNTTPVASVPSGNSRMAQYVASPKKQGGVAVVGQAEGVAEDVAISVPPVPVASFVDDGVRDKRLSGFWTQHVVGADRVKIEEAIIRCADHGDPYEMEIMYERADGEVRFFRCGGRRSSPTSTVVYGYIQDVTDRKRTTAYLEQRVHLLDRLADATLDASIIADVQEEIVLESSELLNLWAGESLEGMPMSPLFNSWTLNWLKGDLSTHPPELNVSVIITNPNSTQQQCKAEMVILVDADDPARVFIGLKHVRSCVPPYTPLRKHQHLTPVGRATRTHSNRGRSSRARLVLTDHTMQHPQQPPTLIGYMTGWLRWMAS